MTVLVSGAAGFLGSSVAEALAAGGDGVIAVDAFTDYATHNVLGT